MKKCFMAMCMVALVSFDEVSHANQELVPPTAAPADMLLQAVADDYVLVENQLFESGAEQGLGVNDINVDSSAIYSLQTYPQHGTLTLAADGAFTYQPTPGFVGVDSFIYSVSMTPQLSQVTVTLRVVDGAANSGFTPINPSADSRLIYVSNSEGNDSNDCLSEQQACRSLEKGVSKMRAGYPDHLYLKRGDRWRTEKLSKAPSGRSSEEPAVIAYYGAQNAPRPIIESNTVVYKQSKRDISHLQFIGLHFYGYKLDPKHPEFDPNDKGTALRFFSKIDDILIEDCVFDFAKLTMQQWKNKRPSNFTIRRNIFKGIYDNRSSYTRSAKPSSVFTYGVDGQRFEENVFDYGGWNPEVIGAGANMLSHNLYLQNESDGNTTVFKNNISVRAASHGIQMRSGGLAEDNFFARNAIGLLMGYDYEGREVPAGTKAHAINNVISEGQSMFKGVDFCKKGNLCSRAMWGLDVAVNSAADYQAHGNIVSMLYPETKTGLVYRSLLFNFKNGYTSLVNSNNVAYAWESPTEGADQGFVDPERTLATYNAHLRSLQGETLPAGKDDFDAFMDVVKNRPLGTWDTRYTASAINEYIRAGFVKSGVSVD